VLKISLSTVKRYARIYKRTGDIKPKSDIKTGRKSAIKNHAKFLTPHQALLNKDR
jgi:hypothetical protein